MHMLSLKVSQILLKLKIVNQQSPYRDIVIVIERRLEERTEVEVEIGDRPDCLPLRFTPKLG